MSGKTKQKLPIHEGHAANNDIIFALMPLLFMAVYMYGARPAFIALLAVVVANICDFIVAHMRGSKWDKSENSSTAIALMLVMLFPASVHYYIVIFSVTVAVMIGKYAFGGYGAYMFNPTALGFAAASVCWPEQIFSYPVPFTTVPLWNTAGIKLVNSPSYTLKMGGLPNVSSLNTFLGNYAGPMGATACLVILACAFVLLARRRISFVVPFTFLLTGAAIAFFFPRIALGARLDVSFTVDMAFRLNIMRYELLCGGLIYTSVFLLSDLPTLPKNLLSKAIYGVLLGFSTMMFRYFGSYELGMCFALLAVNSMTGYIDRTIMRVIIKKKGVRVQ
ncbi:MAG: RnfABCDGE type electron transport complex subunit D [Oscillospiraceae bacterium]|nr:RnfABCDGE type electron transport complex subunit D [Oscillospiraceae bacterium]